MAPRGVIEVDRAGLPVVVQHIVQVQVGVDEPVPGPVLAEAGEHGLDSPGCLGEDAPHRRVDGPPGQLAGMPGSGPGQVPPGAL